MSRARDRAQVAAGYGPEVASGYDARHGDARSRARFRVIEAPMLDVTRDARRVLEIGCGTGRLLEQVRAPVRVGIDIAPAMLARARERLENLALADGHALPFADESFDAVIAGKGVFRYLDADTAMAECARVLCRGGRVAVHQYAARTWSLGALLARARGRGGRPVSAVTELGAPEDLYAPAERAGLEPVRAYRFRPVRLPPFAVAVPGWLPGKWWSHCVVIARKR